MISKGKDQSGSWMIGVEISASLKMLKDFKHASSNSKGTSVANKFVSGLAIYEKSFMNRQLKPQ
jgi:hypothetical protein